MTFISGFFNSVDGDRRYLADFFAEYFASFIGNGVFINPGNALQVTEGEDMTTVIKAGKCWINGYYGRNKSDYIIQHDLADGVLKRIDRIVLRLDFTNREILPQLKKGAYASVPVAPALQRDADAYELGIADVLIDRGATQITQANITDTRLDNDLCGKVHGVVDQVDTSTIFDAYQSWIQQQKDIYEADITQWTADQQTDFLNWREDEEDLFNEWLDGLKDILDENVAGNLLQMIEGIIDSKGQPNGIPILDGDGKVPKGQLPPMDYVPLSEKAQPNGVATLGSDGKVLNNQLGYYSPSNSIVENVNKEIEVEKYTGEPTNWHVLDERPFPGVGKFRIALSLFLNSSGFSVVARVLINDMVVSPEYILAKPQQGVTQNFDFDLTENVNIHREDVLKIQYRLTDVVNLNGRSIVSFRHIGGSL